MYSVFFVILALLATGEAQELLNNVPITFRLSGSINYVPTSGGIGIPGYNFTVGFDRYSWLGIQFKTLTSTNNYDTLILQRSLSQSGGVYTCTIGDYYVSSGRPTNLQPDTITNMDQIVTTTSNTSQFLISIPRTLGNTNGEDWQGGQFVQICFFTSDKTFSTYSWTKQYEICYGYQVTNYISTYRGPYITNMFFEGVSSSIYGGVYGPYLKMQLFWYRPSKNMTYTGNLVIQIGNQISQYVGYDYHICGLGDFYGTSPSNVKSDIIYSGYENGACTFRTMSQSTMMTYNRDVYTFDDFDVNITQSVNICIIGSANNCAQVQLPLNLPAMTVGSALTIFQGFITLRSLLIFSTILLALI